MPSSAVVSATRSGYVIRGGRLVPRDEHAGPAEEFQVTEEFGAQYVLEWLSTTALTAKLPQPGLSFFFVANGAAD